jgi:hypothetical protein
MLSVSLGMGRKHCKEGSALGHSCGMEGAELEGACPGDLGMDWKELIELWSQQIWCPGCWTVPGLRRLFCPSFDQLGFPLASSQVICSGPMFYEKVMHCRKRATRGEIKSSQSQSCHANPFVKQRK